MVSNLLRHFQLGAVGIRLEEGIGSKLARLAAAGVEEVSVDIIGDTGRFDTIVQTLIEAMTENVVLLTPLALSLKNGSSTTLKVVFDLQINDHAEPAADVGKSGK